MYRKNYAFDYVFSGGERDSRYVFGANEGSLEEVMFDGKTCGSRA